ncbi:SCO4225 family membrane protein [Streptomyces poriticola]|uniref:SCO4225 family membrane protein n=1 Tax=Streptomyces poriticola TaxID=3120506 RepID=UPI002FCE5110
MSTRPIRTLVRPAFANPASAVYLGLVGAAVATAALEPLFTDRPDASLIWVWPLFLTFPASGVLLLLGDVARGGEGSGWFLVTSIVVAAVLQSLALGAALRALRGRRRKPTAA